MEGAKNGKWDNIHANHTKYMNKWPTILAIYSQGGLCDRGVATILERRQTHTHSTLARAKNARSVNPYPHCIGGGCVNPYQSYVGEASQTLTYSTLAGAKKDAFSTPQNRACRPSISGFPSTMPDFPEGSQGSENSCQMLRWSEIIATEGENEKCSSVR